MQKLGKTEIESKIAEAMELIEHVASYNGVRFTNSLKQKLHQAELILATLV